MRAYHDRLRPDLEIASRRSALQGDATLPLRALYLELFGPDGCSGGEDEIVCGAVDESETVEFGDRIEDAEPVADVADKLIDRPGSLVIWVGQAVEDAGLDGCGAGLVSRGRLLVRHGEVTSPCVWASARALIPCRGRSFMDSLDRRREHSERSSCAFAPDACRRAAGRYPSSQ
jgi:hypothetical protein